MVESTSLLTRQGVKTLGGSNPLVSANLSSVQSPKSNSSYMDTKFEIKIIDKHWIKNEGDDPEDLCLHGHLFLKIGDKVLSDKDTFDVTLSSAALHLMRTIESDYEKDDYSSQLIAHCGYFIIAEEDKDSIIIEGCNEGTDWTVTHPNNSTVKHTLFSGEEVVIDKEEYKKIIFAFADEVERFYADSQEKILPDDDFTRKGYTAFWKEWKKLRNI